MVYNVVTRYHAHVYKKTRKFIKGRDASSEEMAIIEHDDDDTRTVIKPKEYDASHVFDVVETMPSFPGGMKALQEYCLSRFARILSRDDDALLS